MKDVAHEIDCIACIMHPDQNECPLVGCSAMILFHRNEDKAITRDIVRMYFNVMSDIENDFSSCNAYLNEDDEFTYFRDAIKSLEELHAPNTFDESWFNFAAFKLATPRKG